MRPPTPIEPPIHEPALFLDESTMSPIGRTDTCLKSVSGGVVFGALTGVRSRRSRPLAPLTSQRVCAGADAGACTAPPPSYGVFAGSFSL